MGKDGRIFLPKLQLELMQSSRETNLVGYVIEVTLDPHNLASVENLKAIKGAGIRLHN